MDKQWLWRLPKVELHCHLDGSIPLTTLKNLAKKDGLPFDPNAVQAPEKCLDLADYLMCFDAVLPLLQTSENLDIATYAVVEALSQENVTYAEIRFAPLLHRHQGLTVTEVLAAVCQGVERGRKDFGVEVNLIISGMRHHTEAQNLALLKDVIAFRHPYIVACDAAGDEASFDNQVIKAYIEEAKEAGFEISLHSGECGCSHNVYEAIQLGAGRIGHGVAIKDSPEVMAYVCETGTVLELCPISNLQTNAIADWDSYPLQTFLANGVRCTINTDNRTVSNTSLTREFQALVEHCQLSKEQLIELSHQAIKASFASQTVKDKLRQKLEAYL